MKKVLNLLRTTLVGGALFLAPFIILIIIFGKALKVSRAVVAPLAQKMPFDSLLGVETPWLFAIFSLMFICFLAGLLARTLTAKKIVHWLETAILSNLPGYSFMKNLGEEAAGASPSEVYKVVLIRFDDYSQIGFLVERMSGGRVVVFVPDSPSPWTGGVLIVDEDRITLIDKNTTSAVKCLRKLGEGTGDLVKDMS
jgi:uncharacterized membrane protein